MDFVFDYWWIFVIIFILHVIYKNKSNSKKLRKKEQYHQSIFNLLEFGWCIENETNNSKTNGAFKSAQNVTNKAVDISFHIFDQDYDKLKKSYQETVPKISKSNDKNLSINEEEKKFIQANIDNFNNYFANHTGKWASEVRKRNKLDTLSEYILLIASDLELSNKELEIYKLIKDGFEVSDEDADRVFAEMVLATKGKILLGLTSIPTVSQKIVDYIGNEYPNLKVLSQETPENLRKAVPGLTTSAATAIIKKLSWLSD